MHRGERIKMLINSAILLMVLHVIASLSFRPLTFYLQNACVGNIAGTNGEEFAYKIWDKYQISDIVRIFTSFSMKEEEAFVKISSKTNNKIYCSRELLVSNKIRHLFILAHESFHVVQNKNGAMTTVLLIKDILTTLAFSSVIPILVSLILWQTWKFCLIPIFLFLIIDLILFVIELDCNLRALNYIKPKICIEEYCNIKRLAFSYLLGYGKNLPLWLSLLILILL